MGTDKAEAQKEFSQAKNHLTQLQSRHDTLVADLEKAYRTLHGTARREQVMDLSAELKMLKPRIKSAEILLVGSEVSLHAKDGNGLNLDIWLQIFDLATSTPVDREGYILRNRSVILYGAGAPYALSSVCRTWRNLVLATPSLWATFHFSPLAFSKKPEPPLSFKSRRPQSWANVQIALSRHVTRSANSPVNVTIDLRQDKPEQQRKRIDVTAANGILNTLISHAHRWQHVDLTLINDSRIRNYAVWRLNKITSVPLLRTLCIRMHERGHGAPAIAVPRSCPLLRSLTFEGHAVAWKVTGLSTSTLTHLAVGLDQLSVDHLWAILCAAPPTLASLSLTGQEEVFPRYLRADNLPTRCNVRLRHLQVNLLGMSYLRPLIGRLDLYYVQDFILQSPAKWDASYDEVIRALRESVTVVTIAPGGRPIKLGKDWARQLGELPHVREFRDEVAGTRHAFWNTFTKDKTWPLLEVIHSTVDPKLPPGGDRSLTLQALGKLIVQRNQQSNDGRSVCRIREVRVAEEDKQQWLNGLVES